MNFEYRTESIRTSALRLDYFVVPWDSEILGKPVAQIAELRVMEPQQAVRDYAHFADWCTQQQIALCACRLPAGRLSDSMFLEDRGFRFIELNYIPLLTELQLMQIADQEVEVEQACAQDCEILADMAARVFHHGRFHQDPRINPALGDRRYRVWLTSAFSHPAQTVLKCLRDGQIIGFFVTEPREPGHCFWSLVALAPGLSGKGLGKRVWRSVLREHCARGIHTVSTSISSHNIAAFNLYVSLGFRFPQPSITLQWRPPGSGVLS